MHIDPVVVVLLVVSALAAMAYSASLKGPRQPAQRFVDHKQPPGALPLNGGYELSDTSDSPTGAIQLNL